MGNIELIDLRKKALNLVNIYKEDLEIKFIDEIIQFEKYFSNFPSARIVKIP